METTKLDKFAGDVSFIILGVFFVYLTELLAKIFVFPFERKYGSAIEAFKTKVKARDEMRALRNLPFEDPLKRFYEDSIATAGSKRNTKYVAWFEEFKKGIIPDPSLIHAPRIWKEDLSMNPNFLNYLRIQLKLCRNLNRFFLKNTIHNYYPEFYWDTIETDISYYESELNLSNHNDEFKNEIINLGFSESFATFLLNKVELSSDPNKIMETLLTMKTNGASEEYIQYVLNLKEYDIELVLHYQKHFRDYPIQANGTKTRDYLFRFILTEDIFPIGPTEEGKDYVYCLFKLIEEAPLKWDLPHNGIPMWEYYVNSIIKEQREIYNERNPRDLSYRTNLRVHGSYN